MANPPANSAPVFSDQERCQLTGDLHEGKEQLRMLGQVVGEAVWDWNLVTNEVDRNAAAAELFGDNGPIENRTIDWWANHIRPKDRKRVLRIFSDAIAGQQSIVQAEYWFIKSDGSQALIYDRGIVMRDVNGVACRVLGSMTDLTHLTSITEMLARTEAALVHTARQTAMGTMAGMIAHELNQPLAAIVNYTRAGQRLAAADDNSTNAKLQEALSGAEDNAMRAGAIVTRLRELITRNHVRFQPENVSMLIADATAIALIDAESVDVHSEITVAEGLGTVLCDRVQIQQVLINLIRNSVEALVGCHDKRIRVSARLAEPMIEFSVADNGSGVDDAMVSELFSTRVSAKVNGMGIGLSVCRTIIEAHDGKIWLAGSGNAKTEFVFTLPVSSS